MGTESLEAATVRAAELRGQKRLLQSKVRITLFADDRAETHWNRNLSRATRLPT